MTHDKDAERQAFEAWLGIKPCGAAHDLAWSAWKAARRAPAAPVPHGWRDCVLAVADMLKKKADAFADEHGYDDMGGLSFGQGSHADAKLDHHSNLIELEEEVRAMIAAAPKPPEAAPVELPEPVAYVEHHKAGDNLWFDHPGGKHSALYTEQQVRDLLAAHGIGKDKA